MCLDLGLLFIHLLSLFSYVFISLLLLYDFLFFQTFLKYCFSLIILSPFIISLVIALGTTIYILNFYTCT